MLAPRIPNNEGLEPPLRVYAPPGSILNCNFPAPVKVRAQIGEVNTLLTSARSRGACSSG